MNPIGTIHTGVDSQSSAHSTDGRICIAILLGAPLSAQNFERVGIPYLNTYFDVVVFDFKPWLGRSDVGLQHEVAKWKLCVPISSAFDLEEALQQYCPNYALDFVGLDPLTPIIQRILAKAGTRFVVQKSGNLPLPSAFARLVWKVRSLFRGNLAAPSSSASVSDEYAGNFRLMSRLVKKIAAKWSVRIRLSSPDLALLAGRDARNHFTGSAREILWVGSQDYYLHKCAREKRDQKKKVSSPFILFIDDNLPFASDWDLLGLKPPVSATVYYPAMRIFFDALESNWGMPIKIAGHPSGLYDQRIKVEFGLRDVCYGQTADLVVDAAVILVHGSTAVSFAILDKKPVLFMTTEELERTSYGLHIHTMSKCFGQQPWNIDRVGDVPLLNSLLPDELLSQKYVENFIRSAEVLESAPWQAFIDYLLLNQFCSKT